MANTWLFVPLGALPSHLYLGLRGGLLGNRESFFNGVLGRPKRCRYSLSFSAFVPMLEAYAAPLATSRAGARQPQQSCRVAARPAGSGILGAVPLTPGGKSRIPCQFPLRREIQQKYSNKEKSVFRLRKERAAIPGPAGICRNTTETAIKRAKKRSLGTNAKPAGAAGNRY